jgi:hypothetical protein
MVLELLFLAFVALAVFFALCALRSLIIKRFVQDCMDSEECE